MRIHLLRSCAGSLAFALGLAALPAAAQNNNVAYNRRLTLSEPAKASAQTTDSAVRPAAATQPTPQRIITPTPPVVQSPVAQAPIAQAPIAQAPITRAPVARIAAPQTNVRNEVMAGDGTGRSTVLQPIPARAVASTEAAPIPMAARTAASHAVAATPVLQPAPVVSPRVAEAPRSSTTPATTVHTRRVYMDEPQPIAESMSGSMPGGDCCGSDCGGCDDCCGDGWFGGGFRRGSGRWLAGVEFLFARPHFSEATAYVLHQGQILGPGNVLTSSDTYVHHNFDYEPSARGYIAYRLDECCAELRGTYTRLQSDSSRSASPNANATIVPTYFEVQPAPGDTLTSTLDVGGDVFDVDFSRCIRAGGECIPCDCRTCPDWDLSWSAGARLARWDLNGDIFTTDPTDGRLDIDQEFVGAGPKIGLEGKRYFGRYQQFSIYSSFDASLLVGWYEYRMDRSTPSVGVNPATQESFISKMTRTIPVTEIELGVRWQPYERLNISAGWFFQAWWDLGMSTQQSSNLLGGLGPQWTLDDSNIMSWDGLTLRAELSF